MDADHPITDLDNQNPDDDQSDSTEWISAKGSRQFRLVLGIQPSVSLWIPYEISTGDSRKRRTKFARNSWDV